MKAPCKPVLLSALLLFLFAGWCAAGEPSARDAAQRILDAAGPSLTGGLIVHLGCGDGRLAAALSQARPGRFLVQGLDDNEDAVAKARQNLCSQNLYGRTSIALLRGGRLPYVDNLVNLIVCDRPLGIDDEEIQRVLAPLGVLLVRKQNGWERHVKPWPGNIDEWTHFLHGPDNNAVARDRVVGPPSHLQWIADPVHLRSHEHLNSVSALVTARGKIFFIIDEGPTAAVALPSKWRLVARDAFNGLLLWKRDIGPWEGHFRLFRSGPPDIARRLVAVGDRVYASLGYGKPVAAFDAATGKMLRTYDATEGALEIVCQGNRLFVLLGSIDREAYKETSSRFLASPPPRHKSIVALDADSGRVLWKRADQDTEAVMPTTLACAGGRVFFQNTRQLVCLDADSGREQWQAARPAWTTRLGWSAPTLVAGPDVVLSADGSTGGLPDDVRRGTASVEWIVSDADIRKHPAGDLVAFSASTGRRLWTGTSLQGFCNPGDLFVIDGLVWSGGNVAPGVQGPDVAYDLQTGEVKRRRVDDVPPVGGHARCYRDKATERFLVLSGSGVEFVDVNDSSWTSDPWVRGTCQYGFMPANGLLYSPPDSCACQPNARLHGFTAMAADGTGEKGTKKTEESPDADRLERGPAYESGGTGTSTVSRSSVRVPPDAAGGLDSPEWPTYRGDAARSGRTKASVPADVRQAWRTEIGGKLTSLTVGEGKVFVSRADAHTVFALDVDSGKIAWSRTVGGMVDSPPTISRGLVVFGCRDGWVYCLRAQDGQLAWRFRAAPDDRLLVAREGLESVWPVHGSVLVQDGLVWLVAGRSSYLDGGLRLCALKLQSGEPAIAKRLDARDPQSWPAPPGRGGWATSGQIPGTLPDILSASGDLVFMGFTYFTREGKLVDMREPHLFSATGFLDDTWWHRTYWQYGTWMRGGFGGWPQAARQTPAGRLLAVSDDAVFGFGRQKYDTGNPVGYNRPQFDPAKVDTVHAGHIGVVKESYQESGHVDFSQNRYRLFSTPKPGATSAKSKGRKPAPGTFATTWQTPVPMLVRALVLANQTLFIAGPSAGANDEGLADLARAQPGLLWAVSAADGHRLGGCPLDSAPVFDGMAAIPGRLVVSCTDGSVRCLAGR